MLTVPTGSGFADMMKRIVWFVSLVALAAFFVLDSEASDYRKLRKLDREIAKVDKQLKLNYELESKLRSEIQNAEEQVNSDPVSR